MRRTKVCPKCEQNYTDRPAVSRMDNSDICPECGQKEAMEDFQKASETGYEDLMDNKPLMKNIRILVEAAEEMREPLINILLFAGAYLESAADKIEHIDSRRAEWDREKAKILNKAMKRMIP